LHCELASANITLFFIFINYFFLFFIPLKAL
jgi:hypothetical protein